MKTKTERAVNQLKIFEGIIERTCGSVRVLWEKNFPNFTITCYNVNGESVINQIFNDGGGSFTYTICGIHWDDTEKEITRIAKNEKRAESVNKELLNALKKLRGLEPWIGDREMKEMFQATVYPAIDKAEALEPVS